MGMLAVILPYIQIALSVLLIVLVLIQQSDADLGSFGGSTASASTHTRRGVEKVLFNSTILIGILFAVSSFVALIVK
jgi:protein translocase SecG subunit